MSTVIRKLSNRILLLVFVAFVILSLFFIYNSYQTHIKTAEKNQLEKLHSVAKTLSIQMDEIKLKMLLNMFPKKDGIENSTQHKYYHEQHEILKAVQDSIDLETPIYTLTYDSSKSHFSFGITSSPDPYWRHKYKSAPQKLRERYKQGGKIGSYEDKHGTWLTAFEPIKDEKGKVIGVIMVDRKFKRFIMEARQELYFNIGITLTILFFIGFGLIHSLRTILKEEERVKENLEHSNRRIEEKNKELHKLSLVASKTDNIILIIAPDGEVEWVNDHYTRKVGYTLEQLKEEKGRTIFESSNNPRIQEAVRSVIAEKRSVSYESCNQAKDGSQFWTNTTLTPVLDDQGEVQQLIIVDSDITELKEAEAEIREKNQAITASIDYAARIQESIVPEQEVLSGRFRDIFVLYQPKDVVSGDFYWSIEFPPDKKMIAMVDCTCHGVPGAMMSTLGHSLLNDLVNEKNCDSPASVLENLNKKVIELLKQDTEASRSSDGMDLSLCTVDEERKEIIYAGAFRPLLHKGQETTVYKGDRYPIGSAQHPIERSFTDQRIPYEEGDAIYLYSDGYPDQFGGKKGKKYREKAFRRTVEELAPLGMEEQKRELERIFEEWKGDIEQVDDVTVIGIRL
ncbi:MAG: SpoIIE family protein phosphatase [Flavobacteriales bacterium]